MITNSLDRVRAGERFGESHMRDLIVAIMQGEGSDPEVGDLLVALNERGETLDEIVGAARAMRELAVPLLAAPVGAVDTCGTGGDRSGTFNVSTVAALVVAGAGVAVAKHGNRAATSKCGSADVLEALGVNLDIPPQRMAEAIEEVGIGFLFARACHPAMARVAPIRAKLGRPTIFNRLGPLTNPTGVRCQLVGIANGALGPDTREALLRLGSERVWVVHADDGLDEASISSTNHFWIGDPTGSYELEISPEEVVPSGDPAALEGGDADTNAGIARAILAGEAGPRRDIVVLNAAAALCAAGRCAALADGVGVAQKSLDSGAAQDVLERWVEFCS